jgi:hypothetical protein
MAPPEYEQLVQFLRQQLTQIEQRFDAVEQRLDALRAEVLGHFDELYRRLEWLEQAYQMIIQCLRRIDSSPTSGPAASSWSATSPPSGRTSLSSGRASMRSSAACAPEIQSPAHFRPAWSPRVVGDRRACLISPTARPDLRPHRLSFPGSGMANGTPRASYSKC